MLRFLMLNSTTFDPRLLAVTIDFENDRKVFQNMYIKVSGTKSITGTQNQCQVDIMNMTKPDRDYILTNCNLDNLQKWRPKKLKVQAGRESYGLFDIYQGDITAVNLTQPPDIDVSIKALTGQRDKGRLIAYAGLYNISLKQLSEYIAQTLQVKLVFEATDTTIANFSFNGPLFGMVVELQRVGNVDAFLDDDKLIVQNRGQALLGGKAIASKETGMIGIPQIFEWGVSVTMLADPSIKLGGALQVKSEMNPACNGDYIICKIDYSLTNRDRDFYFTCWGYRSG